MLSSRAGMQAMGKLKPTRRRNVKQHYFALGDRVHDLNHAAYGVGTVIEVIETGPGYQRAVVRFDSGRRRIYMSQFGWLSRDSARR